MATIALTTARAGVLGEHAGAVTAAWINMQNGDVGAPLGYSAYADKSIQVAGVFGAGGTVVIEGSNDGVNWATLNNAASVGLSVTGAKILTILEPTLMVRPHVTGGDGTTLLTLTAFVRRNPS